MNTNHTSPRHNKEKGFTYLIALIAISAIGLVALSSQRLESHKKAAVLESELVFRGTAFKNAISSYYNALDGQYQYPNKLQDLIKDPRFPNKRHIRKLYDDPMHPKGSWKLIYSPSGGFQGIASSSTVQPVRQENFGEGLEKFKGAKTYQDWVFEYTPPSKNPSIKK